MEPTIEDFIQMLNDPDPDVRRNAAWTLGRQRDIRIIQPLIRALKDDDDTVRVRVAEALGNIRDPEIVPALIEVLGDDDNRVRAHAAASLGNQGDFRAFEALLELLKDDDASIRGAAVGALGKLPDNRAIMPLVNLLTGDPDPDVRFLTGKTLTQIGGDASIDALLLVLRSEPEPADTMRVIEVLAGMYATRAIEPLQALTEHADEGVSATAKWAIKQLGG